MARAALAGTGSNTEACGTRTVRMSVAGLCQICESRPAQDRCENCGTLACEVHYERDLGLCADCAAQARPDRGAEETDVHRF